MLAWPVLVVEVCRKFHEAIRAAVGTSSEGEKEHVKTGTGPLWRSKWTYSPRGNAEGEASVE